MRGFSGLLVACLAFSCRGVFAAGDAAPPIVVPLAEISVFDQDAQRGGVSRGQWEQCGLQRSTDVKAYPKLASDKPLFGTITVGRDNLDPKAGTAFHFAIDATEGAGTPYDRLYFDANHDLDLTNDAPRGIWKDPPGRLRFYAQNEERCFEPVRIAIALESGGAVALELFARLFDRGAETAESERFMLSVVPTTLRKGTLKIGSGEYTALLGQDYVLTGRFDQRATMLLVMPKGDQSAAPSWWEGDRLMAMHKLGGVFYRFSATPAGDTLTATPYTGDFGTFEMGKGGRTLETIECSGSFMSKEVAVAVGGEIESGWPKPAARALLPVGDYLPNYMTVTYGRLQITLSQNYHMDGKPRAGAARTPVFGIAIRKDKPFVFDFSAKPAVIFATPAKDARVKRGSTLEVQAVLTDPTLDIMIRGLVDSTKTKKVEFTGPNGEKNSYDTPLSLDPTVVITRANGEKVAEGIMPFG